MLRRFHRRRKILKVGGARESRAKIFRPRPL